MKKPLVIALAVVMLVAMVIGTVVLFCVPIRFRVEAWSPSGRTLAYGLCYEGSEAPALDGCLRLLVQQDEGMDARQQTSIPWERDLKIGWKTGHEEEVFVVEKGGRALMEFQLGSDGLKCIKGKELLADDPYR
ncbi:hypothetical protein [Haloferula sp. BvORR071]|uniref:hypothetical protein n=1 Tax=Haloferula sp. BvORR071 TaxID=1396141 RepID=UPI0005511A99|nr:hypothetical protein [Haloferula sp. BvORR071]